MISTQYLHRISTPSTDYLRTAGLGPRDAEAQLPLRGRDPAPGEPRQARAHPGRRRRWQSHVFEGRKPNIIIELVEGISNAPCNVAEAGLLTRCELVRRTATLEELCSVHAPQVNIYSISRYIYIYMCTHLHIYISTYLHIYPARVPARHESAGARHPGPGRDAAAVRRLGRGHRHRLERHPYPHRRQGRRRVRHRARQ